MEMIKKLLEYVWPNDRPDIKKRVKIAMGLLVASKVTSISVPFIFGRIVDALNQSSGNILNTTTSPSVTSMAIIFSLIAGCEYKLSCVTWCLIITMIISE